VRVDNDIYRRLGSTWWDDEVGEFGSMRFRINPVRLACVDRVIGEVARVPGPGGLLLQEWRCTAFAEPNTRVWEKLIKPAELVALLQKHGLDDREMRGLIPRRDPMASFLDFHRRAQGRLTLEELGRRLDFGRSNHIEASYTGYAARRAGRRSSCNGIRLTGMDRCPLAGRATRTSRAIPLRSRAARYSWRALGQVPRDRG
jgi:hypothetical protein